MSVPPPASTAEARQIALGELLPYGRPVRRRIGVPVMLAAGAALGLALWILHASIVYYRVDSGSMLPTLPIGSRVAVEPGVSVRQGEIIAFHPPTGAIPATPICAAPGQGAGFPTPCGLATSSTSKAIFIKRVVAGPGSLVSIRAGVAVVNGVAGGARFATQCGTDPDCNFPTAVRVPPGQYYVLGDNRETSDDSRFWGPVPAASVVGVVVTCQPLQTACTPRR